MKIYTNASKGATVVSNIFIDQYMPHANGEFVKVYLYLQRCADTGREFSLSSIADVFEHTEKDIQRALAYWEKQKLLRLELSQDGTLISVTFLDFPSTASQEVPVSAGSEASPAPEVSAPSRSRIAAAREQQDIKQLFFIAEQYLQRPLTSSEQSDFIYYYETLQFSTDLIEYLIEYCISKGSPNRHYMRKVALAWAEAGISTVMQAKQETTLHNRNYFTIMNTFGIKGRNPAAPEQETMARWFDEYGFTLEIIVEACKRTIRQTHQPNFEYADKILEKWHQSGVTSMNDIEKLDLQRKNSQKKPTAKPQKASGNRFNNFSQREYDYNQLEKQLLNQ